MTAGAKHTAAPGSGAGSGAGSAGTGQGPATSAAPADAAQLGANMLLAIDDRMREAASETELVHLIANETRKLVLARQVIVLRAREPGLFKAAAVSSVALVDRDTPFIRWVEGLVATLVREGNAARAFEFQLPAFVDANAEETRNYPFAHFIWQPLRTSDGTVFAALLLARERLWGERDVRLVARQGAVSANAWQALYGSKALQPKMRFPAWTKPAAALAALVLACLPVPMTTLAPVEIVANHPQRVTAPIDGIIKDILVDPNKPVSKGQPLVQFDETTLRARFDIADRDMLVAQAQFDRAQQAAFNDDKARHDLAQARTELELKKSERSQAESLLKRTVISAERDGVVIYPDKDRFIGKPVKTGERLMLIADPQDIAASIEVPVADAIVLEKGARIRMFLDANPLVSVPARLASEGYHAEPNATQQLVYRLYADLDDKNTALRIGSRGTAQVQGGRVPLIYYLLRRPISAARQHLGL